MKEGRTISAAETEKFTPEEGVSIHGWLGWFDCEAKALKRHDSRRHIRDIQKSEKAEKKKKFKHGQEDE